MSHATGLCVFCLKCNCLDRHYETRGSIIFGNLHSLTIVVLPLVLLFLLLLTPIHQFPAMRTAHTILGNHQLHKYSTDE